MTTTTPAEVRGAVERVQELRQDLSAHLSQARPGDFVIRQQWVSEAEADLRTLLAELARLTCAVGEAHDALRDMRDAAVYQTGASDGSMGETLQAIATEKFVAALARARTALNPSKEA